MNRHNPTQLGPYAVPRRILVLATSYPSDEHDMSGIGVAKLVAAIGRRGYAVSVVAPSNGVFQGRRVLDGIETFRFGYCWPRSLAKLTRGSGGIAEHMAESLLARLQVVPMTVAFVVASLRELYNSDVVYANGLGAGLVGAVVNLTFGTPLVVSLKGDDERLVKDSPVWRTLTRWVNGRASVVAATSNELINIMRDLGVSEDKCCLPHFGVDTDWFHPMTATPEASRHVRLLFVGSLIRRKGLQDLLDALDDPGLHRVRLTVVGEGSSAAFLKETANLLGLKELVDWKGALPQAEVARIMRSSDIFCLPSYMEGRPNAVNEAMASGLPVIVTRIGGIPDMVREGETALLFEPGDVKGLRECIKTLVDAPDLRRKMGASGYDLFVRSGVSWDSTAEEIDTILSRVIEESR